MPLYLFFFPIHVFDETIYSKNHSYHMRPVSVHKLIANSAQSFGNIKSRMNAVAVAFAIVVVVSSGVSGCMEGHWEETPVVAGVGDDPLH